MKNHALKAIYNLYMECPYCGPGDYYISWVPGDQSGSLLRCQKCGIYWHDFCLGCKKIDKTNLVKCATCQEEKNEKKNDPKYDKERWDALLKSMFGA